MPLAFEDFQGKGGLDLCSSDSFLTTEAEQNQTQQQQNWLLLNKFSCYVGSNNTTSEPTSVLDTIRSPSSPTSSSTLSYNTTAHGGTTTVAAATAGGGGGEKCGLVMEDWEELLSGSPGNQEPSILRLIMGGDIDVDVGGDEDDDTGLNKILQPVSGSIMTSCPDIDFNGVGFGVVDQGNFGFESIDSVGNSNNLLFCSSSGSNLATIEGFEEKPQIFNPQLLINQNQTQNQGFFLPVEGHGNYVLSQPPNKRINFGPNHVPQHMFRQQQQQMHMFQQRPGMGVVATTTPTTAKQKMVSEEFVNQQLQQTIFDQVLKAAELIETGNLVLAQGILARLNHQLSHIGKPFHRAAFYFKEALQSILNNNTKSNNTSSSSNSCFSVVFKIGAYKSFSEISPILQFANFTCNQALLEAFEGCDRIHIVDFDIGYGGQWSSFMQELVMRPDGPPSSFRITAFASSSTHDELELGFTQENLKHFATELNIPFELEFANLDSFNSIRELENEVLAVNLPVGAFSSYPTTLPLVLRFVKQLSPKIIVSLDRGCDRSDLPFPHHIIHALQSFSGLLESLDAVNLNLDALQKIERFLIHPNIEKVVLGRHQSPERLPPWKSLFMQSGFSPLTFSNFAESQADCLMQRTPVRGFRVEKRQSLLVLCWQRKDLISASAWRC